MPIPAYIFDIIALLRPSFAAKNTLSALYLNSSEKIPDSNGTFAYSNVIQDSVLEISYYPDKPKEKYDLCKKCTNMLINFLKEKKENTIYEK